MARSAPLVRPDSDADDPMTTIKDPGVVPDPVTPAPARSVFDAQGLSTPEPPPPVPEPIFALITDVLVNVPADVGSGTGGDPGPAPATVADPAAPAWEPGPAPVDWTGGGWIPAGEDPSLLAHKSILDDWFTL